MRACALSAVAVNMLLASPYSWTGNGTDDAWCNHANWDCLGFCLCVGNDCGFPDGKNDDAGFRTAGPFDVDLCTVTVDDVDISVDVDFDAATPATLKVDSLTITGSTITLTGNATIKN